MSDDTDGDGVLVAQSSAKQCRRHVHAPPQRSWSFQFEQVVDVGCDDEVDVHHELRLTLCELQRPQLSEHVVKAVGHAVLVAELVGARVYVLDTSAFPELTQQVQSVWCHIVGVGTRENAATVSASGTHPRPEAILRI